MIARLYFTYKDIQERFAVSSLYIDSLFSPDLIINELSTTLGNRTYCGIENAYLVFDVSNSINKKEPENNSTILKRSLSIFRTNSLPKFYPKVILINPKFQDSKEIIFIDPYNNLLDNKICDSKGNIVIEHIKTSFKTQQR